VPTQCLYVLFIVLVTNSDYCAVQHKIIAFLGLVFTARYEMSRLTVIQVNFRLGRLNEINAP